MAAVVAGAVTPVPLFCFDGIPGISAHSTIHSLLRFGSSHA